VFFGDMGLTVAFSYAIARAAVVGALGSPGTWPAVALGDLTGNVDRVALVSAAAVPGRRAAPRGPAPAVAEAAAAAAAAAAAGPPAVAPVAVRLCRDSKWWGSATPTRFARQTSTIWSAPPVEKKFPHREKLAALTAPSWPDNVKSRRPARRSHIRVDPSRDDDSR
jgi:hypothetical protein